jgi:hypothetical protein
MKSFLQRYGSRIHGILHGLDRVRFRGTLRALSYVRGMSGFLFGIGVPFKDFEKYVRKTSLQIRQATHDRATASGRPLETFRSPDKEAYARFVAQRDGITAGLIGIFGATESCLSYEVRGNGGTKKLELHMRPRKCLHYYHYYLHPTFGLMHVRLQTWFPFSIHVCLNGREWLARQLDEGGIPYQQSDNCLVEIADLSRAQQLADAQLETDWPTVLGQLARQANPAHDTLFARRPMDYYWSVEQSEWASDVLFRDPADLARLYPQLVHHDIEHLSCADVLRFLGRKEAGTSEIHSSKKTRREGVRVKHWINGNSIKMYDKQGQILRIETTLNNVSDYRAYRTKEGDDGGAKQWMPMRKGVADLARRAEVSQAGNSRYLDTLATVEDTTPLAELTTRVCQPVHWQGQRARALNPLADKDAALLTAVNRGEFTLNGFRNRDLRPLLFGDKPVPPAIERRQAAAVTRQLRLLRAHGLIRKVSGTHRYILTDQGRTIINALLAARQADTRKLTNAA